MIGGPQTLRSVGVSILAGAATLGIAIGIAGLIGVHGGWSLMWPLSAFASLPVGMVCGFVASLSGKPTAFTLIAPVIALWLGCMLLSASDADALPLAVFFGFVPLLLGIAGSVIGALAVTILRPS